MAVTWVASASDRKKAARLASAASKSKYFNTTSKSTLFAVARASKRATATPCRAASGSNRALLKGA